MFCWLVDIYGTGTFVLEELHGIALGLELFGFILPALPVTFSARGFVLAGLDLRNSHYVEKSDVHNFEAVPITAVRGRETDEETQFLRVLVDQEQRFVLNSISVEVSHHDQEFIRIFLPELLTCKFGGGLRPSGGNFL